MNKGLYWASWLAFFISMFTIIIGAYIALKNGEDKGLILTIAPMAGLALSGLLMNIAVADPEK